MKTIKNIRRFASLPLKIAISKLSDKLFKRENHNDLFIKYNCQYLFEQQPDWLHKPLNNFFAFEEKEGIKTYSNEILFLSEKYLNHEFNYFMPQWYKISFNKQLAESNLQWQPGYLQSLPNTINSTKAIGKNKITKWLEQNIVESFNNISSAAIEMLSDEYEILDWQLDYKSGYRWSENELSKKIIYGNIKGVDIKFPWELGRMQHLPIFAFAGYLSDKNNAEFHNSQIYFNEFKNQILDFIAMNPIGFGVQWTSSMDIGLRAASWLVSYDLFNSFGHKFNEDFDKLFKLSIYYNCKFILDNLEWSSGMRGNHYLANIAAIIFISAYLPATDETTLWLAFGIQELINEVLYQFNNDGSNFEASINYHFFAADMVFFSIYILLSLKKTQLNSLTNLSLKNWNFKRKLLNYDNQIYTIDESTSKLIFPDSFIERINKIIDFTMHLYHDTNSPLQIGDNDSGRFLKLIPNSDKYSHLFLAERIFNTELTGDLSEKRFLNSILKKIEQPFNNIELINRINYHKKFSIQNFSNETQIYTKAFPDFGLYIFQNYRYKLFFRCGSIGQKGKGGHSHNDQLSMCLYVDNLEFMTDSGTFTYTSDSELRNLYRSTKMHNTLNVESMEQNRWDCDSKDDLFWISRNKAKAKIVKYDNHSIEGVHFGFDKPHFRKIYLSNKNINIEDNCKTKRKKSIRFHLHPDVKILESGINNIKLKLFDSLVNIEFTNAESRVEEYFYSPNYGIRINSNVIIATLNHYQVQTKFSIH